MIDWKKKLTSRKLWAALVDFVGMLLLAFGVAETTVAQVSAIIMAGAGLVAYIVAEGLVDAKASAVQVLPVGTIQNDTDTEDEEDLFDEDDLLPE